MDRTATIMILVPSQLRAYSAGARELELAATSVRAALQELERRYPSLYRNICDETGLVRRHLNLFVNASHIRDMDGLDTALVPGDEVVVLPAVSGG
ncbi:MAG: MoaD/ThiS family protein [Candidatus Eisenbacteria bacterium]